MKTRLGLKEKFARSAGKEYWNFHLWMGVLASLAHHAVHVLTTLSLAPLAVMNTRNNL